MVGLSWLKDLWVLQVSGASLQSMHILRDFELLMNRRADPEGLFMFSERVYYRINRIRRPQNCVPVPVPDATVGPYAGASKNEANSKIGLVII